MLGDADVNSAIKVSVTASNSSLTGGLSVTVDSAVTGVVQAVAPSDGALPSLSSTGSSDSHSSAASTTGSTLSVSAGSWSGSPAPSYTYQWQHCNPSGEECVNISGATRPYYTLSSVDVGYTVRAAVTASNPAGSITVYSSAGSLVQLPPAPSDITAPSVSERLLTGKL